MLQKIRKTRNLSQSQLAEKANVNFRMLQHYEQGTKDINQASFDTLLNLSIALGCKISDLITNEELIEKCKRATL